MLYYQWTKLIKISKLTPILSHVENEGRSLLTLQCSSGDDDRPIMGNLNNESGAYRLSFPTQISMPGTTR